jgi:hypothetical protein
MTERELTNKDILVAVSDYTLVPEPPRDACCDSYHVYIQYQRVAQAAQRKWWKWWREPCPDHTYQYVWEGVIISPNCHHEHRYQCPECRQRLEAELGGQE